MGCDIHPVVEVRRRGQWATHRPRTPYPYYGQWPTAPKYALPNAFSNRNYVMFAVLADVTNDIDQYITPMTSCRGVPPDLAPGSRDWAAMIDHSPGWVTLAELEAYDWSQSFIDDGQVYFLLNEMPEIFEIIEYLRALVPRNGSSDDVRLLFDFDS